MSSVRTRVTAAPSTCVTCWAAVRWRNWSSNRPGLARSCAAAAVTAGELVFIGGPRAPHLLGPVRWAILGLAHRAGRRALARLATRPASSSSSSAGSSMTWHGGFLPLARRPSIPCRWPRSSRRWRHARRRRRTRPSTAASRRPGGRGRHPADACDVPPGLSSVPDSSSSATFFRFFLGEPRRGRRILLPFEPA